MSNVFVNFPIPQFERWDPVKSYTKALTLQQLTDAREYQRALAEKTRIQAMQERQEYDELQRFRQNFTGKETPAEIFRQYPTVGPKFLKSQGEALEQGRKATQAELARKVEQEKLDDAAKKRSLYELSSIRSVEDPETQARLFMEWQAKNPRLGQGVAWPLTDQGLKYAGERILGPDEWQKYTAGVAEEGRKEDLHKDALRKGAAEATRSEQVVLGEAKPSPAPLPALFEQWVPGYLESNNLADTAKNRTKAVEEYHKLLAISQGMSPEALQQRLDLFSREAALKAEGEKNKPMSAEASKVLAVANSLVPELTKLRSSIQTGGRQAIIGMVTGSDPVLARVYENAADLKGRLRSGGAMNKDETANFKNSFGRPSDVVWGTSGALAAIESALEEAQNVEGYMKPGSSPPKQPAAGNAGNTDKPRQRWGRDANGNPVRIP